MHNKVKLRRIGNSLGVVLPRDLLARAGLTEGDELHIVQSPDGFIAQRTNPEFDAQMAAARLIMRRRRAVLRELAK